MKSLFSTSGDVFSGLPGPGGGLPGLVEGGLSGPGGGGEPGPGGSSWSGGGLPGPGGLPSRGGGGSGIPACTEADTLPPVDRQTPVKTLPWPQIRCGR